MMASLLMLAIPTVTYALGIFPLVSIWLLAALCFAVGTIRYWFALMIFLKIGRVVQGDKQNFQSQWLYNFASVIATCAFIHAGFQLTAIFWGVSTVIAVFFLTITTYAYLTGKEKSTEEA